MSSIQFRDNDGPLPLYPVDLFEPLNAGKTSWWQDVNDAVYALTANVRFYGAVGDGVTDDTAAFERAKLSGLGLFMPPGTYKLNNITIVNASFAPGAKLAPSAGQVVTINTCPICPAYQIFDLSFGGVVSLPFAEDVHANWWGAIGNGIADSTAGIQAACAALLFPDPDGNGGRVHLTSGLYLISSFISIRNRTVIRGAGFFSTEIKPTPAYTDTRLIEFKKDIGSQFGCRLEELQLNCDDKSFSLGAVYAPSWNEHCGLRNVHIRKLGGGKGVFVDNFYGGSAQWEINNLEVVGGSAIAVGSIGVHLVADPANILGFNSAQIKHLTVTSAGSAANLVGLQLENRLMMYLEALHFESCASGLYLLTECSIAGSRIQGGPGNTNVIDVASNWTGRLNLSNVRLGNSAVKLLDRRTSGYTYFQVDDTPEPLLFPPEPEQVLASARCTGGITPVITGGAAWAKRISAVSRNGVGNYRFTLTPSFGGADRYGVTVCPFTSVPRYFRVIPQTANTFDVIFTDSGGVSAETDDFVLFVSHKP